VVNENTMNKCVCKQVCVSFDNCYLVAVNTGRIATVWNELRKKGRVEEWEKESERSQIRGQTWSGGFDRR
jgi:hypothetical protein